MSSGTTPCEPSISVSDELTCCPVPSLSLHFSPLPSYPPPDLLVHSLFKQGSTVNPEHEHKYTYVLAYAASVWDQSTDVRV